MSDCTQCADYEWCAKNEECGMFKQKQMTNADRIRAMTDEELAKFFLDCVACDDCPVGIVKCKREFAKCMDAALDWLEQEATDVK